MGKGCRENNNRTTLPACKRKVRYEGCGKWLAVKVDGRRLPLRVLWESDRRVLQAPSGRLLDLPADMADEVLPFLAEVLVAAKVLGGGRC